MPKISKVPRLDPFLIHSDFNVLVEDYHQYIAKRLIFHFQEIVLFFFIKDDI